MSGVWVAWARSPGDPIGDFLFRYRSGHCEYFATAMVLMLRSQGIPARFVTGFLGGENNRLGYYIVRQSNAHAWVEAYLPDSGWTVFDPTPPAGRPAVAQRSLWSAIRQAYDFMGARISSESRPEIRRQEKPACPP